MSLPHSRKLRQTPGRGSRPFTLVVLHYHLRPGGIRRVIELATPQIAKHFGRRLDHVVLATGEASDKKWDTHFRNLLRSVPLTVFQDPALNYFSRENLPANQARSRVQAAFARLAAKVGPGPCVIWAHNLGIGRNLLLADEVSRICRQQEIVLLSQHHDWWFDNRWLRWPEMRASGFRTFSSVARTILPSAPNVRHLAINRTDAEMLEEHFGKHSGWLPNLAEREPLPPKTRVKAARSWLDNKLGIVDAPVWILPCRLLRRKNIAEALLLTRWLRPEAWLVTTRAVSSAEEVPYFNKFHAAIKANRWPIQLGIMEGDESNLPNVSELLALSEAVLLTSIQEGFGLPYLEAAAAERPLIASRIPNIAPDLEAFGFHFPQYYDELLVDPRLFDWKAEFSRQTRLFRAWKAALPPACRQMAGLPVLLAKDHQPAPVPFGRLTLTAQLEVLAQPVAKSWEQCAPLNPFLVAWKKRAATGGLRVTAWPTKAGRWLSGPAYARRFEQMLRGDAHEQPGIGAPVSAQAEFIREKLHSRHMFPLLWSPES